MPPDSECVETVGSVGVAVNSVCTEVTQSGKKKKSKDHVTRPCDFIVIKCKLCRRNDQAACSLKFGA